MADANPPPFVLDGEKWAVEQKKTKQPKSLFSPLDIKIAQGR
jgi:hypothetical protein